ncbi:MAG: hypothetical protein ACYC64_14415 [Armatimonadota bacterium]
MQQPNKPMCTREQEIEMCRGKTARMDVYDDRGNLIVAKGEEITDSVLHQAVLEDELDEVATAAGVECQRVDSG